MNQYILKSQDVSIHFNDNTSPLLEKTFFYQDSHRQVLARGDEISDGSTSRGREVTVTLEQGTDGSKLLFTLLIPRLSVDPGKHAVGFRTLGLLTHREASSPPQTAGQSDTYECVPLSGKMEMIVEGARSRQEEGESVQGFSPERFELKGDGVELELNTDISTGAPKSLHYKDSSSEVNVKAEKIQWSKAEFGMLVTIKLEEFTRKTVDPGTIFFTLLIPRMSNAAVQPISTKGFRTISRPSPRSAEQGQFQTYEVVNLEGKAIIFMRRAAEESVSPNAPA